MFISRRDNCNYKLKNATPAQVAMLEKWLFDDKLSFVKTAQLAGEQLGLTITRHTLRTFFQKQNRVRTVTHIASCREKSNEMVNELTSDPAKTYQMLIDIGGKMAFDLSMNGAQPVDLPLVREFLKIMIAVRRDELANKKFLFDRERWEFDVSRRCANHFQELQELFGDDAVDEDQRLQTIRKKLFGENLPN